MYAGPVYEWMRGLDWGTVPDWVEALATAAAFIAAGALFVKERQAHEVTVERFEREDERRRRDQASKIAVWVDLPPDERVANTPDARILTWQIHTMNASGLPIYDAEYDVSDPNEVAGVLIQRLESSVGVDHRREALLPNEVVVSSERYRYYGLPPGEQPLRLNVALFFRDAAGLRWMQTSRGVLKQLHDVPNVGGRHIVL